MRREVENVYPLSPMQKGMLFHSLLEPQSEAYFEQVRFDLHGNMDVKDFEKSVNDLVKRHAIFRTNFYNGLRDEPLQVVYKNKNIEFNYKDLRKMNEEYRKEFVNKIVREDRERGFNLAQDSLIRMVILHIKENTYHLIWSFHHILMDGWCLPLIFKELFENYYAIQKQRKYNCAPVIPYSQYVEWLEEQDQEEASNYWSTYLAGYQEQTLLPKIKSQGMDETYVSEKIVCNMGKELTKSMKRVANDNHVTINTLLQTAWGILLQKYNNSKDVVFGSVVSGRPEEIPGIENMIGLFINTIPVRIHHEEEVQFAEAMKKNQELALASHVYDTYPLYEIQALTEQQQNLINHIMVFENYPAEKQMGHIGICNETALEIANLEVNEQTNYDFNLIVMPGEEIHIHFQYNANVYEQATIERIQGHMIQIIKQVVNNPNIKVSELKLLTEREKTQILDVFNKTEIEYSNEKTIHQLFEEQVQRTPNQVAVVFEDQQLTYQELNERANQLARTLKAEGVRAEQLVAIMAERSLEMIIGILGILKSGGAYVPIDPEYPEERIQYMLKDSKAQLLLLQHHLQDRIPFEGKLVNLNDEASYHKDGSNLKSIVASNQLAYVIYTSGTTGKPKGVMVEHHGLCNLKSVMYDTLQMNEQDKVVQFASLSFDASIWEIFTSLFFGATLYIPSKSVILDYHLFNHFMNENKITTALLPPAYATYLEPNQIPALKKLVTGGSASSFQLVEMWKDKALYVNAYGPTEDSIITTMWSDSNKLANNNCIPIGCPIHNHQVYIMDKGGQLLPIGVAGELCIAGSGVARGYLNRPGLTKEKFVENPFNPGEKMYKTGDLARWLPDGNIEYLGRMDHQVKIRGYRIETGEVETALLEIELIQEAIIIAKEDKDGLKQLCAYYVGDDSLTVGKLRSELSKELPNYMIPSYFVKLTQMPLTPNGKVDRKALLELEGNLQTGTEYEAPRTVIEVQLAEIWKEVLGLKQVGVKDNFFDIGGHSLRATILISKIHKEMNVSISLREIFRFPTLQQMAGRITDMEQHIYVSIPSAEEREYYPVSSSQKRMYILNQLEGGEISYNITNVITVKGDLDCKRLEEAFRQLIQRHESLRTGFEMVNGKLMQRIETNIEFSIEYMKSSEKEVDNYVRRFVQAFNLQQAPLMRVGLIEIEPEHYLLLLDMHHIISDGISMNIIMKEWIQLYEGEELPPLRIGYKDYAVW
ncbi:amino acid adenylation domain-containing protein, partial [Bacillus pseudomycoides]|nr:amino acid adenylation domain-containing protein [Bacillus pseudomycoides]